jgi:hypothetical protein
MTPQENYIKTLEKQLANREKQNVLLRELLEHILNTYHVPRVPRITETLAATQYLSDLIICDAEPVGHAYLCEDTDYTKATFSACDIPSGTPLYKVRKP